MNKKEQITRHKKEHITRHKMLHDCLDELIADYINMTGNRPSKTSLMDLMEWSFEQTINPTEERLF